MDAGCLCVGGLDDKTAVSVITVFCNVYHKLGNPFNTCCLNAKSANKKKRFLSQITASSAYLDDYELRAGSFVKYGMIVVYQTLTERKINKFHLMIKFRNCYSFFFLSSMSD